jgi:divalent metal cation (Fe/Co/Zn/Cd) transporter
MGRTENATVDTLRTVAIKKGVRLEVVTIAWMAVEAALALGAGIAARSVLLTAFGVDSVIELLSGITLFRLLTTGVEGDDRQTVRISAVLLVALCGYVVLLSLAGLLLQVKPEASLLGIGVTGVALVAMPMLARAKHRVNEVIASPSLRADIAETVSCAYLAAVTLTGLLLSMMLGWWWVEYVAALALLVWLVPEAGEALEEWRHNGANHGGQG